MGTVEALLLPARMLNEHAYCPRLFALEWLHGEWADNADTVDGRRVHRRVDRPSRGGLDEEGPTRQLWLSDEKLRLTARLDLVERDGGELVPVEYKRGSPPEDGGAWLPERVQLCAQGLLLRAHGHRSTRGLIWFAEPRRRVEVEFDEELIAETLSQRDAALARVGEPGLPAPLVDSPKCPRCSLVGICLPDETNQLAGAAEEVRPISPRRADGSAVHVRLPGGSVGKRGEELVIRDRGKEVGRVRLRDTVTLVVHGNITVSAQALAVLAEHGVPVGFHSFGGWFRGMFVPAGGHGVPARVAQHAAAVDPARKLAISQAFVAGKIRNCRVLLRRNAEDLESTVLPELERLARRTSTAADLDILRGLEGAAARLYFANFPRMLRALGTDFDFRGRNRRPPRDPVNAALSFAYACLARECTAALHRVGLDPFVGFLHEPRPGRPALALDLMEEFRPIVADSVVLRALNTGEVDEEDFVVRSTGTNFTAAGKKSFLATLERRLDEELTHPRFGTRLSYRRTIEVQARLLARTLLGELERYPALKVR